MLISFAVTNFRSIRERLEFNMLKTGLKGFSANYLTAKNRKQLLRSLVLYGPNASGKSNLLRAMRALEYLVNTSSSYKPDEVLEPYEPFRLDKSSKNQPVVFEIVFMADDIQFDYVVSFTLARIETEELHFYPSNTRTLLYSRTVDKDIKFGDSYKGAKKTVEKLVLPNQLFLSKAVENNVDALMVPYRYFRHRMMVFTFLEEKYESTHARLFARRLAENMNSAFSRRFNALICAVDTGICSVSAEEVDWSKVSFPGNLPEEVKKKFQEDYKYDIKTIHPLYEGRERVGEVAFDFREESDGTKSLFAIGGIIIEALQTGSVLVVDEFEKSLHPGMTQFLIKLFHNPQVNKYNAQLIFATHDVSLLSIDNFRRDQVWFSEKDEVGVTNIFRCSDIPGLRLGAPLDKWYASGRLGATPVIHEDLFITEMQTDEQEAN